jgi:hypothetical protein
LEGDVGQWLLGRSLQFYAHNCSVRQNAFSTSEHSRSHVLLQRYSSAGFFTAEYHGRLYVMAAVTQKNNNSVEVCSLKTRFVHFLSFPAK